MHNPGVWMNNPLPLDLAVGFFTQSMTVGDVFESSATQYGIWASKTFGVGVTITPYAGITMETSNTSVQYNYSFDTPGGFEETVRVKFDLDGENQTGFNLGANLSLIYVNLNIDYKIAATNTATAGLSFGF